MSETTTAKTKRKKAADYETIADQLLADMRHLETLMQSDRMEIDRLKMETHLLCSARDCHDESQDETHRRRGNGSSASRGKSRSHVR